MILQYILWDWKIKFSTSFQTASSSGDPHVHIIKQVKPTDEGLYTCIAGNVLGQATASAYLEVNSARSLSCSPLLFLLLLLLIAQNKLWINRLTRRQQNLTQSWTYCQDPKNDTKNWRCVSYEVMIQDEILPWELTSLVHVVTNPLVILTVSEKKLCVCAWRWSNSEKKYARLFFLNLNLKSLGKTNWKKNRKRCCEPFFKNTRIHIPICVYIILQYRSNDTIHKCILWKKKTFAFVPPFQKRSAFTHGSLRSISDVSLKF